jgi:hypothetical protein
MSKEPLFIHVYNALTGEETQREMTPEEVAEREAINPSSPNLPSVE